MNNSFMNLSVMPERTFDNPYEKEEVESKDVVYKCHICGEKIYNGETVWRFPFDIEVCDRAECKLEVFEEKFSKHKKIARKAVW